MSDLGIARPSSPDAAGHGILYVDNDPEARFVVTRFLENLGSIRVASTLYDARARVADEPPALLLIDPALPDGDGIDVINEVRARHPWVQVFGLVQQSYADRMARLIAAGVSDIAVKPFDVGTLRGRAAGLLRSAEVVRKEFELRRGMEARLQHVERIATLGTLCATVAHEIANPLQLIVANTGVLIADLSGDQPIEGGMRTDLADAAAEIALGARMIDEFIVRIRQFARRDEAKAVNGPLARIVDTVMVLVKPRLPRQGVRIVRPTTEGPSAPHYPIRFTQALLNVLNNALEADGVETITIRWIDEGDLVGVAVDDDGAGLGEEMRRDVREPFFTTKAGGTGLGLVLVQTILREHDGRFELLPREDARGTTARLLLPRAGSTAAG